MTRSIAGALALAPLLLVCAPARAQPASTGQPATAVAPSDEFAMVVEYRADQPVSASEILSAWAAAFDALVVQDPQIQGISIRFLTHTDRPLTWGTIKALLAFHDVLVEEHPPSGRGPWRIEARHRRNAGQAAFPTGEVASADTLPSEERVVTGVFPIQHGAGSMIFATLRGIQTRDPNRIGNLLYVQGPELILAVDFASRLRYYAQLVAMLDVAGPRKSLLTIPLEHALAAELAALLTGILGSLDEQQGGAVGPAGGRPGPAQVFADVRTNTLAVSCFPIDEPLVRRVVDAFDRRVPSNDGPFYVYRPRNLAAKDLAAALEGVLQGAQTQPAAGQPGAVQLQVTHNEELNAILIRAEPQTYQRLLGLLAELDRPPARVLVRVEVWEVSTPTDQLTLGVELLSATNPHEGSLRPSALTGFGLSSVGLGQGPDGQDTLKRVPGLGAGLTAVLTQDRFDKLPIVLSAVASFERVRVVTRSFAKTDDNKLATFTIAESVPIVQQVVSDGVTSPNVSYVDATSTLRVKPRVNSDRSLTLEVGLTLSSFAGSGSANLPPGKNSRDYSGQAVTVPNDGLVVFSGLESETERTVETKVPLLGDIPLLGHLFKSWSRSRSSSRVYIFVRPTIIDDEAGFAADERLGQHQTRIQLESGRAEWLPELAPTRVLAGTSLQDESFAVFGTGSGDPFGAGRSP